MGEHKLPREPPRSRPMITVLPIDANNLYRETAFTDLKAGIIKERVPVVLHPETGQLIDDLVRQPSYEGQTFINGQPLSFAIAATSLAEAVKLFSSHLEGVLQELQSKAIQSKIMSPAGPNGRVFVNPPSRKR